jgi:hypothetical protein
VEEDMLPEESEISYHIIKYVRDDNKNYQKEGQHQQKEIEEPTRKKYGNGKLK